MDYLCGPYEVTKNSRRKSFCIMMDNSISMRTYLGNVVHKNRSVKCTSLDAAMKKLEELHSHKLQYKGYSGQHLGKVPGAPAPVAVAHAVPVQIFGKRKPAVVARKCAKKAVVAKAVKSSKAKKIKEIAAAPGITAKKKNPAKPAYKIPKRITDKAKSQSSK